MYRMNIMCMESSLYMVNIMVVYIDLQVDKVDNLSGVQYSPLDMAEYVFWTGDEKGVTLAIEEFLQEGLVRFFLPKILSETHKMLLKNICKNFY